MTVVTIKDVAHRAGVSSATVSRVLSGKPHVRPEISERVMQAAKELNYRPSRVARSLRAQKSTIIGLLISDIMNPFFTSLVRAVEDIASQQGYAVFLCNSDESVEKEAEYIHIMQSENVAGLLITPTKEWDCPCRIMLDQDIPVVTLDRTVLDLEVDSVVVDNLGGAEKAVSHLIRQGHERIAAVVATSDKTTGRERLEGYRLAHERHGLPVRPELIFSGVPKKETGRELARQIRMLEPAPTAVFCGNNLLSIGVIGEFQDAQCRIPEDFALVSFDDLEWYTLTQPQISAVRQPVYELGRLATELLFERINGSRQPVQRMVLDTELIVRGSSPVLVGSGAA